jgi:hypothetical protein
MAVEDFATCVGEKTSSNIAGTLTGLSSDQLKAIIDWWKGQSETWQLVLGASAALITAAILYFAPEVGDAIGSAIEGAELKSVLNAMVQCYDKL